MNTIIKKDTMVESMIFEVRGVQVMLSSDVSKLYQVETKVLNQTIKRNIKRFPEQFCFQLTEKEFTNLRSHFVTSSYNNYGGTRYLPYVLTEQGIMMLSGLLKSDIAVKVNIRIIDAFVKMKRYFANENNSKEIIINHENRLLVLENTLERFKEKKLNKIFFEGQIYDSYSILIDILNKANKEIIVIDNYAGKELLDIIKSIDRKIILVSKNINKVLESKYSKQYSNILFINNDSFHDRFIIIDRNKLYCCGASFKDLGKKCFSINELNDKKYLDRIIKTINL